MESVKELFLTSDLYSILKISKEKGSDAKALKAAYLKMALAVHPDKAAESEREISTKKFQILTKIYELLQNDDLRKAYDETGLWPENEDLTIDLTSFGRLDEHSILSFKKNYVGSDEEREDIKKYYEEGKGSLIHVMENVFFANILEDEERFVGIIEDLIEKGTVKKFTKGADTAKAKAKFIKNAKKEAAEADEMRKEMNLDGGLESLKVALAKNSAKRNNFLDELEKKYAAVEANEKAKKGKGKPGKTKDNPVDEKEEAPKSKKAKLSLKKSVEPSGRVTRSNRN